VAAVTGLGSSSGDRPAGVRLAGRYRLVRRIAAGAVGEVWLGSDLVRARPVAVKLLRAEHAQHADTLARFRAEARHAGSLTHPAITQVYDYGDGDESRPPYIVMELVDGPSFAQMLNAGPLAPASAMDLVAQAAAGLRAVHRAGLVHRDIKPGNLLLGPGGQVKITDFGLARAAGSASLTRTGMLICAPAYLAPERVSGGTATPASDLYSLGIVAWECLAGAPPFSGMAIEVAFAHRECPLPPLPGGVPGEVAALVAELAAKDPATRPAAAQAADRARSLRDALTAGTVHPGIQPDRLFAPRANAQPAIVREVIHLYNARGLAAPQPPRAGGRPRRINDDDIELIVTAATTRPHKPGLPFTHWSLRTLAAYLAVRPGRLVRVGRERLRQIRHARQISFQRTRTRKESADPGKGATLDRIEHVTSRLPDNRGLLANHQVMG
jgi:serine/threonine-protein kinase